MQFKASSVQTNLTHHVQTTVEIHIKYKTFKKNKYENAF